MIVIQYTEGHYVPLIQCDVCHDLIEDVCDGLAAQKAEMREGERIAVLHVHKGRCFERVKSMLKAQARITLESQDLNRHLHYLAHNMGMNRVDVVTQNIDQDAKEGFWECG